MSYKIELSVTEASIIENALNAYWNDAHEKLENNYVLMSDGTKRPLGDIEKEIFTKRKEFVKPILDRFENL